MSYTRQQTTKRIKDLYWSASVSCRRPTGLVVCRWNRLKTHGSCVTSSCCVEHPNRWLCPIRWSADNMFCRCLFFVEARSRRRCAVLSPSLQGMVTIWCNLIMLFWVDRNSHWGPSTGAFCTKVCDFRPICHYVVKTVQYKVVFIIWNANRNFYAGLSNADIADDL